MKYTNKWVVIPYSTYIKNNTDNISENNVEKVLKNETLDTNEKLNLYNHLINQKKNIQEPKNNASLTAEIKNENLNDESHDEIIESEDEYILPPINKLQSIKKKENFNKRKYAENILNGTISQNQEKDLNDSITNKSFYKAPPAKNTRSYRRFSPYSYDKIKAIINKKRKISNIKNKLIKTFEVNSQNLFKSNIPNTISSLQSTENPKYTDPKKDQNNQIDKWNSYREYDSQMILDEDEE